MTTRAFDNDLLHKVRRAAFGTAAACSLAILTSGWRLYAVRGQVADLRLQIANRQGKLLDDRRAEGDLPKTPAVDGLDRSKAVSKLRMALASAAASKGVSLAEFEVSPDEAPYLTAYASDSKDPGWIQVPVRVVLEGKSTAAMATLAKLRGIDVPFEVDTVQMTRRSTDSKGVARVGTEVSMRVLVYKVEG